MTKCYSLFFFCLGPATSPAASQFLLRFCVRKRDWPAPLFNQCVELETDALDRAEGGMGSQPMMEGCILFEHCLATPTLHVMLSLPDWWIIARLKLQYFNWTLHLPCITLCHVNIGKRKGCKELSVRPCFLAVHPSRDSFLGIHMLGQRVKFGSCFQLFFPHHDLWYDLGSVPKTPDPNASAKALWY